MLKELFNIKFRFIYKNKISPIRRHRSAEYDLILKDEIQTSQNQLKIIVKIYFFYMVMIFKNRGFFTMIMKKNVIICYMLCLASSFLDITLLHSSDRVMLDQAIQKSKNQMVQIVEENDRLVTECQKLFETISQETEQANKLHTSWLTIYESYSALKNFTEQATSFLKKLQEYKKTEPYDTEKNSLLQSQYEHIANSYQALQSTLPLIHSFICNDMKTYKQLVDSIKTNMQKLEENTPLKKSISLQFFNANKQLEAAIAKHEQLIKDNTSSNDLLSSHATLVIEKNKNFKNKYISSIDELKNNLEILESCKMPNDSFLLKVDNCQKLYFDIKQTLEHCLNQKQPTTAQNENMISLPKQEKKSIEDRVISNIQSIKKNNDTQNASSQTIQDSIVKRKNSDKEIALAEKKETARLKAIQKQEEKIKKQEEKKQKKAQIALLKKEKQQLRNSTSQLPATDRVGTQKSSAQLTHATSNNNQTFLKAQESVIEKIAQAYNSIIKELELLQQQEEYDNTVMTSHHEKYIILESDIENLEKQINLFISIANHLKIKDTQPILHQISEQESVLINEIKRLNAEQHTALIKQQFIKEQNNIKLEQLLQKSFKLYETELEELKKQNNIAELEKTVQTYEMKHHENNQKVKELKEQCRIKTDKIAHVQKALHNKIQEFEQAQKTQAELLQTALLSQKQIDTLTPINKQQLQLYKQFALSQKKVTAINHTLLQIKNSSQNNKNHQTPIAKNNTPQETTLEKKQLQQELPFLEKTQHELIDIIEKKRKETVYQLQELQYHEEKENLLRASLHDQETYAQEQLTTLKKHIFVFQDFLQETSLTQDEKDTFIDLCNKQKTHVHLIEKTNEEIEQLLIFQQNIKEQHLFEQEEFLKTTYQTYNTKLEFFKNSSQKSYTDNIIQQEDFYTLIKKQEDVYDQTVELYKKEFALQKNKILEKQKLIQQELQSLKDLESTIEKTVYSSQYNQRDRNHLELLQKKQAQSLELCIRSQQAIEQKIDLFLSTST